MRQRAIDARIRFERAQKNAVKAGTSCVPCFIMQSIVVGGKCSKHGGGAANILRKLAGK
jgi:predicted DsbA family dithiol-disulfide isomerase